MNQPCLNTSPCSPCDDPLANLSSETPDALDYIGESFVDITNTPFTPKLGTPWISQGCLGLCVSQISQADADQCAKNQVAQCEVTNNPGTQLFFNQAQSCTVICPDGLPFTYTVRAGMFLAFDQASANAQASALACRLSQAEKICLGSITDFTCAGIAYSSQIIRTGGVGPFRWEIVDGVPPQGILLSDTGLLSGSSHGSGVYTFTVRVTAGDGSFQQKEYTIRVMSIDSGSPLPNAAISTPYIYNILSSGGVAPLSFQIVDGELPSGLTLNEQTGVISGTPTVSGTFSFAVKLQDQAT